MYDIKEIMLTGLSELGISVTDTQITLFEKFMELMLEWNNKINLTAIIEPEEVVTKHFIDSLVPLKFENKYGLNLSYVVDMGTGGGFPGVPIKIMKTETEMILVDSLKKRINYLEFVIQELGLKKISALHYRAEEVGMNPEFREQFSSIFSRAVATMNILVEYCLPLINVDGVFVALKGPTLNKEMVEAEKAIKLLGGEVMGIESLELPIIRDQRTLIFIKKIKETPGKYPRKPGIPKKHPL